MAGLPWFELDVDFHESPKVRALASRLREPLADAYVARLYAYCYRHARDRFDPLVAAETIEEACRWKRRRGALFDALFLANILERDAGKVVVHGVAERLGPHLAHRQAATDRQRKRRAKATDSVSRHAGVVRDVTRDVERDETRDVTRESRPDKNKDSNKDTETPIARSPQITVAPVESTTEGGQAAGSGQGRKRKAILGPLGAVVVARCAKGLGHGLAPLTEAPDAKALEDVVKAHGGADAAVSYFAATCRTRGEGFDPRSARLVLDVLRDPLPQEAAS